MGPSHVSHAWRTVVAVLFVVTGFLMTESTAVAMTTPVANETLVRSSDSDRYHLSYPVVDGDIVAWSEWDDESPTHSTRVCAYDVATTLLRANGGPSILEKRDLALDWPWLLWTQTVSGSDPTAPTDVYGWNLSSDSTLAVAAANGSQQVPAVSDGAYSHVRPHDDATVYVKSSR